MKLDVMAIGAHPDDVDLCCGGTIAKLSRRGKTVGLLDLTEGELGTRGNPDIRAQEAAQAGKILGASIRQNLRIADGNIENTPENRARVIQAIRKYRPEVLLIPYSIDRHPDHEHAHLLAREGWFYAGLEKIVTLENGKPQDPWRPRACYCFMQWHEFEPSFIVDVTNEFEVRMEAMRAFRSQFYDPENRERSTILSTPEFLEMIRTRLAYYGARIGKKYGEPFFSSGAIAVDDIVALNG